jgi:hypothetical protein
MLWLTVADADAGADADTPCRCFPLPPQASEAQRQIPLEGIRLQYWFDGPQGESGAEDDPSYQEPPGAKFKLYCRWGTGHWALGTGHCTAGAAMLNMQLACR